MPRLQQHGQGFPARSRRRVLHQRWPIRRAGPRRATAGSACGSIRASRWPPGGRFQCMETVYGVAKPAEAGKAFIAYLRSRMRRVAAQPRQALRHLRVVRRQARHARRRPVSRNRSVLLDNLAKLAEGQRETGCRFDYYSIEFWADYHGDLKRFDPKRFPNGFDKVRAEIARLGIAPALWIDSSWELWSIGGNPAVQGCLNFDPSRRRPRRRARSRTGVTSAAPPSRSSRCTPRRFATISATTACGC